MEDKTTLTFFEDILGFDPNYYVEQNDYKTIEELLGRFEDSPVVVLRGRKGEGKSWFLLYWLYKAVEKAAGPPTEKREIVNQDVDSEGERGGWIEEEEKQEMAEKSECEREEETKERKKVEEKWVQFVSEHEVFVLLCEALPVDASFLETLKKDDKIHIFVPPKERFRGRLQEEDLRGWFAQEMQKALGISTVIPDPQGEAETQFQLAYRLRFEERAQDKPPLFIVDSIDVLDPPVRDLLERLYLHTILDVGGKLLLTMREGSQPSFKRRAITEAAAVNLYRDPQCWTTWIKQWVARRLNLPFEEVGDVEEVWHCLTRWTKGFPFLMALAWGCAREEAKEEDPGVVWEQLQKRAQTGQKGDVPCSHLRRCMRRWWIRLTFAPYFDERKGGFCLPFYQREPLSEEAMDQLLESLCTSRKGQEFDPYEWERPELLSRVPSWEVLSFFQSQGLLTWKEGFYLDDTIDLLFSEVEGDTTANAPDATAIQATGG